jgi:predicted transcriptional regulator
MNGSTPTKLRSYREELTPKVSQEKLARQANVTLATYRNAEAGKTVQYSTAKAILDALNAERQARQLPALAMDDISFDFA